MALAPQYGDEARTPRACYAQTLKSRGYTISYERFLEGRRLADRTHMILLVDDDDDVRETSADMLAELGYEVIQASGGLEALKLLESVPSVDVLVTDIRMPGMSGLELADCARDRRANLKIILISGYFLPQPIQRRFLQKPFRTHELDQAIQAELQS